MAEEETSSINEEDLYKYLAQSQSAPTPDEKHNVHTFLFRVATADDTTKVGNVTQEELGMPNYPIRSFKEFALISDKIIGNTVIADYFKQESENTTATSLSKEGFLDRLAITTTRQVADITKPRRENKSWFKKKDKPEEGEVKL